VCVYVCVNVRVCVCIHQAAAALTLSQVRGWLKECGVSASAASSSRKAALREA